MMNIALTKIVTVMVEEILMIVGKYFTFSFARDNNKWENEAYC